MKLDSQDFPYFKEGNALIRQSFRFESSYFFINVFEPIMLNNRVRWNDTENSGQFKLTVLLSFCNINKF